MQRLFLRPGHKSHTRGAADGVKDRQGGDRRLRRRKASLRPDAPTRHAPKAEDVDTGCLSRPKQKRKVTNWGEYDASLRQRGSLTLWFSDEAIAGWQAAPRTTPGGQAWYSPLAILTALTLRAVFRLALRQTEGLIGSIIRLLGLTLAFPTTPRSAGGRRRWTCRNRASAAAPKLGRCICWWIAPG